MPAAIHRTMNVAEWGLLVTLSMLWGGSFFFNAVILAALPPFTLVAARLLLGAGFLYLVVRIAGRRMPVAPKVWAAFLLMGVLNNVIPFSLIAWGQTQMASGLASIFNATTPFFTVLVAHIYTRDERMTPATVAGLLIGFGGVVMMMGADALLDAVGGHLLGQLAILAAALSYAFSAVFARRFARTGVEPLPAATGQIAAAALVMVPIALIVDRPWALPVPGPEVFGAILGLAALATCLAYVIYYRILATAGAVNLMLVTFLIPVSAILLGTVILGERLSPHHFLGMAAIGIGLGVIDGRPLAWLRRRQG